MSTSTVSNVSATSQLVSNAASATSSSAASSSSTVPSTNAASLQNKFLTLLVAQLNNQDPMNPMDNNQVTTQMAQLSTVSGIQQLDQTVSSMATQFSSLQAIQAASLVGQNVLINGSNLTMQNGSATAGVNLASNADAVTVNVINSSGKVVDTMNLGALSAGQNTFQWQNANYANATNLSIQITATANGKAVSATPQVQGTVQSVNPGSSGLTLNVSNQPKPVAYSSVISLY